MTQLSNGRTAAKALFEAGDRPTDQNFTNLFDSILFLGESNLVSQTLTSIQKNFSVGGSLSSGGAFIVDNIVMFGKASGEEQHDKPLQVYGHEDETIIFASGSISNVLFEGISGDATSSIKLLDSSANVGFGTYGNKGFLSVHNEEIITYSTGSSAGDNIIYMSGSLGIGISNAASPLHIVDTGDEMIRIQDSDTNGNPFISFFQSTTRRALIQFNDNNDTLRLTSEYGDISFEANDGSTPGTDAEYMRIKAGGNVGIGTSSPDEKLEIKGNFAIRNASDNVNVMLFSNANSVTTHPDIQFNGSAQLSADQSFNINIDSSGVSDSKIFSIKKDDIDTNGTEIFKVTEAGQVSGSSFIGDGSGLTNLTAASITNLLSGGSDNRVVTSTGANSIQGETLLTFDGDKLKHFLDTGNTSGDGIILDGQAGGSISFINNTSTSNEFLPFIRGVASSGMTGANVPGLYIEGEAAVDHADNPAVVIRAKDSTSSSATEASPVLEIRNWATKLITVLHNGKMGIGTPTPITELHVRGGGDELLRIEDSSSTGNPYMTWFQDGTRRGFLQWVNNEGFRMSSEYGGIKFRTGASGTEITRIQILADGKVGIGTATPGHKLHISDSTDPTLKIDPGSSNTANPTIKLTGPSATENEGHHIVYQNADGVTRFDNIYDGVGGDIRFRTRVNGTAKDNLTLDGNGYVGINQTSPQNMLHVRVDTTSVGTSHDNDIGILIQQDGAGDAGIEFETSDQYWSIFNDNSQNDLLIRDISNSRTIAQFTDAGNVILGHAGHVYGRSENAAATKLYRFGGLYLTWDSDSYGTNYNHSITSTRGVEGTPSDDITINSYGSILMNIDSNTNGTETFKIGHKTVGNDNILFTLDETGLITTTNTIKMADTSDYWLATGSSTNWGLYWDTSNNTLQWRGNGTEVGYIDLDQGNCVHRGWMYCDYARLTTAPGSAVANEIRLGITNDALKIQSEDGWMEVGAKNASHAHFYTDRTNFYFDKEIQINGGNLCAYDDNLILRHRTGGSDYLAIYGDRFEFVIDGVEEVQIDSQDMLLGGKVAFEWSDSWLRVNQTSAFTSGIWSGNSVIATNNGFYVGASGEHFKATTTSIVLNKTTTLKTTTYANSGIYFGNTTSNRRIYTNSSGRVYFQRNGYSNSPYIESGDNSGIISFTGQHQNKPSANLSNYTDKKGYIVVSTGEYANMPEHMRDENNVIDTSKLNVPNIDEALPTVELSTIEKDKKVWGVIAGWDDPDFEGRDYKNTYGGLSDLQVSREDDRLQINSLGEGAIMVSNYNGNFENGDYITTSPIAGVGMKQDDDLLHNYTVAKITQDEDFSSGTTTVGSTYKGKLVGCTYHCG